MEKDAKLKEDSPFFLLQQAQKTYCFEHKTELLKEQPQLSIKDVETILEGRFCSLNAEKKILYMKKGAKLKEEKKLKLELSRSELILLEG